MIISLEMKDKQFIMFLYVVVLLVGRMHAS